MNTARTDLAEELRERLPEGDLAGIDYRQQKARGITLTRIDVRTEEAARRLGKPAGTYYTAALEAFPDSRSLLDGRLKVISSALERLLPPEGGVLVAGLGNLQVTPDALGPKCAAGVLATRHIPPETETALGLPRLREVSVIAPGVTGQTGMEAAELIAALCERLRPAAVIAVDALAAAGAERLVKTVQIASTGISPGSGVGNARRALDEHTLGVPVVSLGVPTVVDALSLAGEAAPAGAGESPLSGLMVTPRDIDAVIDSAARLLSLAINCALQKNLTPREILGLT